MTTGLYNEALIAAEEIKNAAEEKVKQRLIEAMTPQIKQMIENNIMSEMNIDDCGGETTTELDEYGSTESQYEIDEDDSNKSNSEDNNASKDDQDPEDKESASQRTKDGSEENPDKQIHGSQYEVSDRAASVLSKIINANAEKTAVFTKLEEIKKGIKSIKKAKLLAENSAKSSQIKKRFNVLYKNLVLETKNISSYDIIKKDKDLLKEFFKVIKELNNMSRRRSNNNRYLNENLEDLLEMNLFEEDEEGEDNPFDSDMPDDSDDSDMSDDMSDEKDEMSASVSAETTVEELAQMAGLLEGEPEEEPEAEDIEEGLWEMDNHEGDHSEADDHQERMEEKELDEDNLSAGRYDESYSRGNDVFLEIDENMLRKEIGRMKRLREGEAKDMAAHFGGGSLEGEMFVDGVELNKLHEMKIKAAKVVRMNRMLESKLSQYKKALRGMKTQLTEMNLFNAKLLYANKLMQNRDLTIKQQRNIVESLDEAKTLGEAKILFESLSKSLVRPTNTRKSNLSEGAVRRPMSSSSRPVSSGQAKPLNESVALDRWATLAGIKK